MKFLIVQLPPFSRVVVVTVEETVKGQILVNAPELLRYAYNVHVHVEGV
jgi:hypothetical protein